jgi:predicted dehydrogenase
MRAAIIGCGPGGPGCGGAHSIAYAHGWAMHHLHERTGIQLVAAATRSQENLDRFMESFPSINGYNDYRAMLATERPEFVSVCAFPPDRESMVLAALDAGAKAILVEKPFAVSVDVARRMIAAAEAHGARLFVHFQRRYGLPFQWVHAAIAEGKIGELLSVQLFHPGPQFINFGPHLIDTAMNGLQVPERRYPVKVLATAEGPGQPYQGVATENNLVGNVLFNDGTRLMIESGIAAIKPVPLLRFNGTQGFAELHMSPLPGEAGIARLLHSGENELMVLDTEEDFHHGKVDRNLYIDRAFDAILSSLREGTPCQLDAESVMPGLQVMLALFESARQHQTVAMNATG